MRPTFSRFDLQDLLDTLPPFLRHPMAIATMASVLAHGVVAVGLPVLAGTEKELDPERVVDVISLSPAEQAKLPSNGLMMPGGGLNGTSALPLPLGKNGSLSPLAGLSGSTLGSNSSSLGGTSGLLDPPLISYSAPSTTNSLTTGSSDSSFKRSSSKLLFPGTEDSKFSGKTANISNFSWANQATEQNPDRTADRDNTSLPPGEKPPAKDLPALQPGQTPTPEPATEKPPEGVQSDAGGPKPGTPTSQPTAAPALASAQVLGAANFGESTKPVDSFIINRQAAVYQNVLAQASQTIQSQASEAEKMDAVFDTETILRPLALAVPLNIPPMSDQPAEKPVAAEFLLLVTPQGTIYVDRDQKGNPVVNAPVLRETGYVNLNNQAATFLQTQLPVLQKALTEQLAKTPIKPGKYGYLKVIFTIPDTEPKPGTA